MLDMFGQGRVHNIPMLGVSNEDIELRLEELRCVQTGGDQSDAAAIRLLYGQRRTAVRTETSLGILAGDAPGGELAGSAPGEPKRRKRHHDCRQIRPSRALLAIPAVALEHKQWRGAALVSNRSAKATAGEGDVHERGRCRNPSESKGQSIPVDPSTTAAHHPAVEPSVRRAG